MKTLAHPASSDSIPTWSDQEDHVSMGAWGALKAAQAVEHLETIVACELLCAAQGLDFRKPLRPGRALIPVLARIRRRVPPLRTDRFLGGDILEAAALVREGTLWAAAMKAAGRLG
jgi:histidine ammonia-lyase